jgi:hypothetical protein
VVGVLSLVLLALAAVARYGKRLAGGWRTTYVVTAVLTLYFNVFVLTVQLFAKIPALAQLAPTQREAPFAATQVLIVGTFVLLLRSAVRGFKSAPVR